MDLLQKLREQGWHLTEEGIGKLPENVDKSDVKKVVQAAMDMDLRDIGSGAVPAEISKKNDSIPGRVVLQVARIKNLSAPKANEDSKAAPRFLQIDLTDGVSQVIGLEFEHISSLSLNVAPGTKIYLKSETIPLIQNFLVLRPTDVQVLGGKVPTLFEKWETSRTLQKYERAGRTNSGTSGPPPWIPFGQKIQQNFGNGDKNFKSLSAEKDKEGKENNEFEAMRSEAIAEAAKAGIRKVFGGGNQPIVDHNVKKIMEKGFSEEEAKNALKSTRNNLERALYNLKRREEFKVKEDPRDKPKKGIKESKKSKDDSLLPAKPAGNVSLFDFLTDKLPITSEVSEKAPVTSRPDRTFKSSSEPPKAVNLNHNQSHYGQQQNFPAPLPRDSHQSTSSIHSQSSGRPKFENNISSSFANRNVPIGAPEGDRGRSKNLRGGPHLNSYQSRQNDYSDKNREYSDKNRDHSDKNREYSDKNREYSDKNREYNQRGSASFSRSSKPHERPSYQNGPTTSRNRPEYQQKNGYDKYAKGPSTPRYPPKSESGNPNNPFSSRNYNENRQSSYTNESSKINKIIEETANLKIDNKPRSSGPPPAPRGQHSINSQQYQPHQKSHHQPQQQSMPPLSAPQQSQSPQQQTQPQQPQKQHPIPHGSYAQLPNGFAYDPSKIMGFQNKETNEFAMNLLKSQAINTTIPVRPPAVAPPQYAAPPPMQIAQHAPYAAAPFVMQHAPHPPPPPAPGFGMGTGENWNNWKYWKVGDRCLAKYWDDGKYYEAEIRALTDKTCVVYYFGYGNHEEVMKSDCLPLNDGQHRNMSYSQHQQPATSMAQQGQQQQQSNLSRGGSSRYRGERQMYVPPPKREA